MGHPNNPVSWFEIPVGDIERAKNFYERVLEVRLTLLPLGQLTMALFPAVQGGAGATGSLVKAKTYVPSHSGSMVYFAVEDLEATLARVVNHGGKTLNPKTAIGDFGFVGHFEDPEGNRVALHSRT
jgi:predicted enzyme related to lactoylglutathione lyase